MENDPFIDDFPIKTSIYKGFSMAMLNNQMVTKNWMKGNLYFPVEDIAIDHQVFFLYFPCHWPFRPFSTQSWTVGHPIFWWSMTLEVMEVCAISKPTNFSWWSGGSRVNDQRGYLLLGGAVALLKISWIYGVLTSKSWVVQPPFFYGDSYHPLSGTITTPRFPKYYPLVN